MQSPLDMVIGLTAGIVSAAMYAIAVVIYRSQREEIRPVIITAFRMWIALPLMVFLMILNLFITTVNISIQTTAYLLLAVLFLVIIGDTIYLMGQERIGVSFAFPIAMSFPILTYFFAIMFLNDSLLLSRLLGIIVTILGIILISRDQESEENDNGIRYSLDISGLLLAICAAILYAAGTVLIDAGLQEIDAISANFLMIMCGSIIFVPLFGIARFQGVQMPSRRASKIIAVTGFFDLGLSFLLIVVAIEYVGATIASVLSSLAPLFAVPISVFYLNEHATKKTAIGVILSVLGVIFVVAGI